MLTESLQNLLQIIRDDLVDVGGDLQPGATAADIGTLSDCMQRDMGANLPQPYVEFIKKTNGLSWGGVAIFGTSESPIVGFSDRYISSLHESNKGFRNSSPLFNKYVVFGSEGDLLLSYNVANGSYEIITVFMSLLNKFSSFEEMIYSVLIKQL